MINGVIVTVLCFLQIGRLKQRPAHQHGTGQYWYLLQSGRVNLSMHACVWLGRSNVLPPGWEEFMLHDCKLRGGGGAREIRFQSRKRWSNQLECKGDIPGFFYISFLYSVHKIHPHFNFVLKVSWDFPHPNTLRKWVYGLTLALYRAPTEILGNSTF